MERQCTTSVVVYTPLPRTCMFGGLGLSVVPGGFASLPVRLYHQWSHAEEACANGLCGAGRQSEASLFGPRTRSGRVGVTQDQYCVYA